MKIGRAVRPGRRIEKKGKDSTGQDRTGPSKKSHKVVIFQLFLGKAPTVPIETKICIKRHLADVIICAKFHDEIFRGYNFTGGRISHFSHTLCMGLTTAALLRCL